MKIDAVFWDRVYRYAVDLFAPNRCPFCERVIPWDAFYCAACYHALPLCGEELCPRCGKEASECMCGEEYPAYDSCTCVAYYADAASRAVLRMKYSLGDNTAAFAQMLYRRLTGEFDLITGVPMQKDALRARGYNQASLMAKRLAMLTGAAYAPRLLIKVRKTRAQKELGKADRGKNVHGAFKVAEQNAVAGKRILLVDDVLTTGSTLHECARILKQAGALSVSAAAFATTRRQAGLKAAEGR